MRYNALKHKIFLINSNKLNFNNNFGHDNGFSSQTVSNITSRSVSPQKQSPGKIRDPGSGFQNFSSPEKSSTLIITDFDDFETPKKSENSPNFNRNKSPNNFSSSVSPSSKKIFPENQNFSQKNSSKFLSH